MIWLCACVRYWPYRAVKPRSKPRFTPRSWYVYFSAIASTLTHAKKIINLWLEPMMLRELLPRALVPRMKLSSSWMIGISIIPFALGLRRNSLCTDHPPPPPLSKNWRILRFFLRGEEGVCTQAGVANLVWPRLATSTKQQRRFPCSRPSTNYRRGVSKFNFNLIGKLTIAFLTSQ